MTYKGHIKNGVVVLDDPAQLPEGAEVEVALRAEGAENEQVTTLSELFADLITSDLDLPSDASLHKRHYLYGHPKNS